MNASLQNSATAERRVALLAGSTGLVGSKLLRLLLAAPDYARVYALSRRPLPFDHPRLANRILPLENIAGALKGFTCHDAFCCVGTTRGTAGSDAEVRRVDLDLVVGFAQAALACGARRLVVLSSAGAQPLSRYAYLATKGEMEAALRRLGFASLDILRPGLLLGWRGELRPLELLAAGLSPLVNPFLRGRYAVWRAIKAADVAVAMLAAARSRRPGAHVYAGEELRALANQ